MIGPADLEAWYEDADAARRSESMPRDERAPRRPSPSLSLASAPPLASTWGALLAWRRRLRGRPD